MRCCPHHLPHERHVSAKQGVLLKGFLAYIIVLLQGPNPVVPIQPDTQ